MKLFVCMFEVSLSHAHKHKHTLTHTRARAHTESKQFFSFLGCEEERNVFNWYCCLKHPSAEGKDTQFPFSWKGTKQSKHLQQTQLVQEQCRRLSWATWDNSIPQHLFVMQQMWEMQSTIVLHGRDRPIWACIQMVNAVFFVHRSEAISQRMLRYHSTTFLSMFYSYLLARRRCNTKKQGLERNPESSGPRCYIVRHLLWRKWNWWRRG